MKKILTIILTSAALLLHSSGLLAQPITSAYFMDGFAFSHELNPAADYDRNGYFSLPFFPSNVNVALRGNLGLSDLLYKNPNGQGLVTYLHPSLTKEKALSGFSDNNLLLSDIRYDLFSFGFHRNRHTYQTLTVGLRSNVGVSIPGSLFSMTRELTNKDYNFSNFGATAQAWAEIGWGYSRSILNIVRLGAKVKLLVGIGYADLKMNNLDFDLTDENRWVANADATAEVSVAGFRWGESKTKEYSESYRQHYAEKHPGEVAPSTYEELNLKDYEIDRTHINVSGIGAAVDLGFEVNFNKIGVPGLKVSAALLDVGFLRYGSVALAQNKGEEFEFCGFDEIQVGKDEGVPLDEQIEELGDRFSDLISLQDGGTDSRTRKLGKTIHVGVQYTLPFHKKLSLGLLSTTRMQDIYSWNEQRISANYHPRKWFEICVNAGTGSLGKSIGWMLNFHPRALNLFIGSDHMVGKLSKQYIPLRSNADIAMGINFPIGRSRVKR